MAERRAVVVGINKYEDPAVRPELKGAENDAREVFARLQKFGGFDIDKKKHLLLGNAATCVNIRRAISDLFWKKDPCDIAVFYFSGHGFLDDYGNGYLAPWNHEYKDPLVNGIRMQELREYFLANNNKTEALLILDCCHSGVTAETKKGKADLNGRFYDSLTNNHVSVIGNGKFILASSGADEKSRELNAAHAIRILDKKLDELECDDLEKHDHGVMTYHLLEGMNGGAAEGDKVKIGRLYDYVRDKVHAYRDDSRNDFKIYDCVCSTFEEGPASQTMLVNASCKSAIDELLEQTKESVNKVWKVPARDGTASKGFPEEAVYPFDLLEAIVSIDKALRLSPGSTEAQRLCAVINAKLTEYQDYLNAWLLPNKGTYLQPLYREEYRLLENVATDLCFERLRQLEGEQRNLLGDFLCLVLGEDAKRTFETGLKQAPFKRAQSKAGGLSNVAPASRGTVQ
jgi:hypothetical protein